MSHYCPSCGKPGSQFGCACGWEAPPYRSDPIDSTASDRSQPIAHHKDEIWYAGCATK
jgi:hypothetical protein